MLKNDLPMFVDRAAGADGGVRAGLFTMTMSIMTRTREGCG